MTDSHLEPEPGSDDGTGGDLTAADLVAWAFAKYVEGDLEALDQIAGAAATTFGDIADELARVPEPLRADERGVRTWAEFAMTLAEMLNRHGESRLANRLLSPDNPVATWQQALGQAQRLRDDGRFVESDRVLTPVLDEARTMRGTALDELLAKSLGVAAANALDLGRPDDALRLTDEALRECERTGDEEGVAIYRANLASLGALVASDAPHREIRRQIAHAQRLHDDGRINDAFDVISLAVAELEDPADPALLATYGAKAWGLLGMVQFRRDERSAARQHTASALELGRRYSDRAAIEVYEANLAVIDGS